MLKLIFAQKYNLNDELLKKKKKEVITTILLNSTIKCGFLYKIGGGTASPKEIKVIIRNLL